MSEEQEEPNVTKRASEEEELDKCGLLRQKIGLEDEDEISLEGILLLLLARVQWLEYRMYLMDQENQKEEDSNIIL